MTHSTQLSPLPPSSSPALSYIDEVEVEASRNTNLQKYTPHVASSSHPQTHPPFEFELQTTPRRQPQPVQQQGSSADPFGFLALELKLKLERTRVHRQPLRPLLEPRPHNPPSRPGRKPVPRLGPEPEPERASDTSIIYEGAGTVIVPEPEVKSTIVTLDPALLTSTPISRHTADITAPPAITPVHIKRRRRRRPTASASASFLFPVDGNDGNPFLVHSSSSAYPTPSPSKDRRERHLHCTDDGNDDNGGESDDENHNLFLIPDGMSAHGDRVAEDDIKNDASPAVSPIRRKRKRTRAPVEEEEEEEEEEGDEEEENRFPKRKTKVERAPLAKKIKTRASSRLTSVKDNKEEKKKEKEGKGKGEGAKRRSARLAKRDPLRDENDNDNDNETRKNSRLRKSRSGPKAKGKENISRKPASRSKQQQQQKPSKPYSSTRATFAKTKADAKDREVIEDVALGREKERAERVAFFKTLDSYELETENTYVI